MTVYVTIILLSVYSIAHSATPILKTIDRNLNWRNAGGSDAPDQMYPYQVSLRQRQLGANIESYYSISETDCPVNKYNGNAVQPFKSCGYHTCGGSIISSEYILTAAHCIFYESASDYYIVVGSNKLKSGGVIHVVTDVHLHKDFSIWHGQNDIALLKVAPAIIFTKQISPVKLESEEIGAKESLTLSGWGSTDYPKAIPDNLQHVNLISVSNDYCDKVHELSISVHQICTSTISGDGTCKGDLGGPLVKIYSDGQVRQVGIVSFDRSCAKGYPDVYTRISSFLPWIKEICNNCI